MTNDLIHIPVLLKESIRYLDPQPNQNFIDCTIGAGGHSKEILNAIKPGGKVVGIDADSVALKITRKNIPDKRLALINDNFRSLRQILSVYSIGKIHGILFDLGMSSIELDDQTRGFSFQGDGRLDMRMGKNELTAEKIVNEWTEREIVKILKDYGEEKLAKSIASAIVRERKANRFESTRQLVELIQRIYSRFYRRHSKTHPAAKTFQALRIAVNQELDSLRDVLPDALDILEPGGRLVVISFHSLEDRIVKEFFKKESRECLCPPEFPKCCCNHKKSLKIITKKPIIPSEEEIKENLRSSSAKLRVAEKL